PRVGSPAVFCGRRDQRRHESPFAVPRRTRSEFNGLPKNSRGDVELPEISSRSVSGFRCTHRRASNSAPCEALVQLRVATFLPPSTVAIGNSLWRPVRLFS